MSIGLIDWDLLTCSSGRIPNLDLMKLSTYYKKNREITKLLIDFNNMNLYNKIYLKQDFSYKYPSDLLVNRNLIFEGMKFSNNIYTSSLSEEIHNSNPDYNLYDNILNRKLIKFKSEEEDNFKNFLNSNLVRLSFNNKDCNIKNKIDSNRGNIKIYDYNALHLNDIEEVLDSFTENSGKKIQFVYPQKVDNDEFKKWIKKPYILAKNTFIINEFLDNKSIVKLKEELKSVEVHPNIFLLCGRNLYEDSSEDIFAYEFENILKKKIYFLINKLKINFIEKNKMENNFYSNSIKLTHMWSGSYSFMDFLSYKNKFYYKDRVKLIEVINKNPNLKRLSIISPKKIKENGGIYTL